MEKFKTLTKKTKKTKPVEKKQEKVQIDNSDVNLMYNIDFRNINNSHKATMIKLATSLPKEIKSVVASGRTTRVVAGAGNSVIELDNNIRINLKDTVLAKRKTTLVRIEVNKKEVLNKHI